MSAAPPLAPPVRDRSNWRGADFPGRAGYSRTMAPEMAAELLDCIARLRHAGTPFEAVTAADAPLPRTRLLLDEAFAELEDGTGFTLLTGFPVAELDREGSVLGLAALGAHLGRLVDQSVKRNKIEDVADRGLPMNHAYRGYMGTHSLAFHTDGSDFAALLCLDRAAEGGESVIVSAAAVYEELHREGPDLLAALCRGLRHHRRGEQGPGEAPITGHIPVFRVVNGRMHCLYNRNPPDWLAREGLSLTDEETAAMDLLDEVMARPDMQVRTFLQPGDIQLINNYTVLHSRTAYRDGDGHRRHLLRLWLESRAPRRGGANIIDLYAPWESRA